MGAWGNGDATAPLEVTKAVEGDGFPDRLSRCTRAVNPLRVTGAS